MHTSKDTALNAAALDKPRRIESRPEFTLEELAQIQWWCLKYRKLVRDGGTPTPEQDRRFLAFSAITYELGVADVEP